MLRTPELPGPQRALGGRLALAPLAALALAPVRDQNPVVIGLVIAFLVLSLALHEVAHGWTALKLGDPTARDMGRLSLNPLVHVDPIWTVIVPLVMYMTSGFIFGGARPVPVDFRRLRSPLRDMSIVAAAGPLTNLALALVFLLAWKAAIFSGSYETNEVLPIVLRETMFFNVLLFIFNLIPIPPLDGSRIMTWLLPQGLRPSYVALERIGLLLIVLLLFFVPGFQAFFWSGINGTIDLLYLVTGGDW